MDGVACRVPTINFLLSGVCHQVPEHCFYLEGRPLPLCARCMGTFLGILVGTLALCAMREGRRSRLPHWRRGGMLLALVGLWAVDGINSFVCEATGVPPLYTPSNALRLSTGVGNGLAISAVLCPIFNYAMWHQVDEGRVLDRASHLIGLLLAGTCVIGVVLGWRSAPFSLWAVVLGLAVAVVLAILNGTLLALLIHKEGFADRFLDIVPYLAGGLSAALLETGALALLRRALGSFGP